LSGHGLPLYSGIYCGPAAATTNCSTISATASTVTCYSVWSNQPVQICSGCGRPFGSLAWQPKNCSGYTTHLWQYEFDSCFGICSGSGSAINVDADMGNPSYTVTDYMMYLNARP
jgi:hypothetical protein